jgi:hypothetical protein
MLVSMQLKILELNATHRVITRITNQIEADENDKTAKDMLSMLWDTALLSSGFSLSNVSAFRVRVNRMVVVAPVVADEPEELPLIVDSTMFNFPSRPSEDLIGYGWAQVPSPSLSGRRHYAGAI